MRRMMKPGHFAAIAGCAFTLFCANSAAAGGSIEVRDNGCDSGIRLTVRGATLSQVLGKLSEMLDFQYRFEGGRDPVVDIDVTRQPVALVKALAGEENLSITQARDRKCPGRDRVVRVAVLPKGGTKAQPQPQAVGPSRAIPPEAHKAYLDDLAAHGMRLGPNGVEETIPAK
jgi:hypothetical protein